MIELTPMSIPPYLAGRGVLSGGGRARVIPLSGGFINNVFRISIGSTDYVLKQ
jgi:hypothetical protein